MKVDLEETGAAGDRRLEALANDTRRHVVAALSEADATLSVTELAVDLANTADGPAGGTDDPVRRRRVELYHRHLPKLADAGLVEFDADRRTVALAPEYDGADATELLAA